MSTRIQRVALTPGEVVRELRLKKGWTQAMLARVSGMAIANLCNIERNRSRLGDERAILLAESLGVKPEFILFPNGFTRPHLKTRIDGIHSRLKFLSPGKRAA